MHRRTGSEFATFFCGYVSLDHTVYDDRYCCDGGFDYRIHSNGEASMRLDLAFNLTVNDQGFFKFNRALD